MKKLFIALAALIIITPFASAQVYDDNYVEHPSYLQGNKYMQSSQYSSAITEYKKALRANPNDTNAIVALSNAYNMRAAFYNNKQKNPEKALSDLKSALFFIKYFSDSQVPVSSQSVLAMETNVKALENSISPNMTSEKRLSKAKSSRVSGEFAAAGYDFYLLTNDSKLKAEANSGLGDIYNIFNRPQKAVKCYQTALTLNPNDTDTHLKLARMYEQTGNFSASLNEYNKALSDSGEHEDILLSLERLWQKKVDENPKDAEAHSNLGVVFQKEKRYQEAMTEYKKAEELNPSNINTKINIGTLYQEQKKYDAALNTYNSVLQSQPKNTNVLLYKAKCLTEQKKNDEAISVYKTILGIQPNNTEARTEFFELVKNTMSSDEVLNYMYQTLQSGPLTAENCYDFAFELHKAKKLNDALVYYGEAIKRNSSMTDAYINSAQIYREKKNFAKAEEMITKAKSIAPDNKVVTEQYELIQKEKLAAGLTGAGNAYESGDYEKAIKLYSEITPETADTCIGIAASYQALKKNDKALEYYKKAMELDPKNADLPYYVASLLSDANNFTEAQKYVDTALQKNPSSTNAKELKKYIEAKLNENKMAEATKLYDDGKYKEAIAEFDKILKSDASDSTVYYYRAMAYDALKDYQKAIADYKAVIKYAPDTLIAYYLIGADYDSLGNYPNAKEYYKKFVEKYQDDDDYKKYAQSRIEEIK